MRNLEQQGNLYSNQDYPCCQNCDDKANDNQEYWHEEEGGQDPMCDLR